MLEATQTQLVTAGSSQISTIADAPPNLVGQLTWRLINDADGTVAIAESTDGITVVDDGQDYPKVRYERPYTAPSQSGRYLAIWRHSIEEIAQTIVVAASPDTAFATTGDVATRLGRSLSSQETSTVSLLLNMAATKIAEAAGYDDGWAVSLNPVPRLLRTLSIELVCRSLPNPNSFTQIRQQVGSYSIAVSQDAPGLALTDAEELAIRRAVHGRTTDSVHVDSSYEKAQDEYWLRRQSIKYVDAQGTVIP